MKYFVGYLAVFLIAASSIEAAPMWGPAGHQITAQIAERLITNQAAAAAKTILDGQSLKDVSTWADEVKHEPGYQWSEPLHFINTPDWLCKYNYADDCVDNICVAGAIFNYTQRLVNYTDPDILNEALKFVVHFIGDIHQPLHVAFIGDEGGNKIKIDFFDHSDNLHSVWDSWIIDRTISESFDGSQDEYVDWLVNQINGPWSSQARDWGNCTSLACPNEWAPESLNYACTKAYVNSQGDRIVSGDSLGEDYYDFTKPVVDLCLAKGGIRLAKSLNTIFGTHEWTKRLQAQGLL